MRGAEQLNYFCSLFRSDNYFGAGPLERREIGAMSESHGEALEATGRQAHTRFMKTLVVISSFFSFC